MHSQHIEEQVLLNYFRNRTSTLLDIGASDGITHSNSRALAMMGWTAFLLEPSITAFDLLTANYADALEAGRITLVNYGIAEKSGPADLYQSEGTAEIPPGLYSSTLVSEIKKNNDVVRFEKITAHFMTFADFTARASAAGIKTFELILIDTEGTELSILKQIDFNAVGCNCLVIEHGGNQQLLTEYIRICTAFGLYEIHRNTTNSIFAR